MKTFVTLGMLIVSVFFLHGCGLWDKPDFRDVKWGMSKRQVKAKETAELVKEGDEVLTYRITGDMIEMSGPSGPADAENKTDADTERQSDSGPEDTAVNYEYDLLYVFGDGKLGMAVIHLRDPLNEPGDYIELFRSKSKNVSEIVGVPAQGVAEYPNGEPSRSNPYETPEDICGGDYVLKHVWQTGRNRTNVSLELDKKKFSAKPDCNLSIFYENTDVEIDPVLRDQLHEVL